MEKTIIEKIADIEANTEIRGPNFDELNERLLKGKIELMQVIGRNDLKGLTRAEGNINYLKGLSNFLFNIKGYLACCRYNDDDRIKIELTAFISNQIREIERQIGYWADEQEAINERIRKDEANKEEAEQFLNNE